MSTSQLGLMLVVVLATIAYLYLKFRRRPGQPAERVTLADTEADDVPSLRTHPELEAEDLMRAGERLTGLVIDDAFDSSVSTARPAPSAPPAEAFIVVLHLLAPANAPFSGRAVMAAAQQAGLMYGTKRIFHFGAPAEGELGAFSMASMVEPGSFDLECIDRLTTPGLAFFMPVFDGGALPTFERMLQTVRSLAQTLGGTVCDDRRSALTANTLESIRGRIRARPGGERLHAGGLNPRHS